MISEVDLKDWDNLPSTNEVKSRLATAYLNRSYEDYHKVLDYLKEVDMIRRSQTKQVARLLKKQCDNFGRCNCLKDCVNT
jgi:hypothetical protein